KEFLNWLNNKEKSEQNSAAPNRDGAVLLLWREAVAVAPYRFVDTGTQLAPELIDHAGNPGPAGVKGVRGDGFINLPGGEHLPWPAGQQEQNIKFHRRQFHHLAGLPHQTALRVDLKISRH